MPPDSDKRVLDDWLSSYLKYTSNSEPPTSYHTWVGISIIAAVLQRKCFLPWGTLTFYPNMYIVLVGPSGKCRKGTAMSFGKKLLSKLGIKIAAEAITREALIRELKNSEGSSLDDQGLPEMHSSLTVYSPELTVFLGYDNKQLISDITDWYDCADSWVYRTKTSGEDDIHNVWVNIIGATTPELIQSALPRVAIGGGLASRMIFVFEEDKTKIIPFPFLAEEDHELWESLENDLEKIGMLRGPFKWNKEFMSFYGDWYVEAAKTEPFTKDPNFAGYISRRATHVLKLSIILSASERPDRTITGSIFKRALKILETAEVKMPRVFSGYGTSKNSDVMAKMMNYIAKAKTVRRKELLETFFRDLEYGVQTFDMILDVLFSMGFCQKQKDKETKETYIVFNVKSKSGKSYITEEVK